MEYVEEKIFAKTDFSAQSLPKGEYERCTFRGCHFAAADLSDLRFLETEFVECDLSNANITHASFQEVVFTNCKMLGLLFEKSNAFGFAATFDRCRLNHSSFYGMKLQRCSFTYSQLENVDFTGAELKNVRLQHCDLLHAVFERTNLEKADLRHSFHYNIDPESNRVKGAQFSLSQLAGLLHKYDIKISNE